MNTHDVESALRDSLRHHAGEAPPAGPLAERVLTLVRERSPRRHWRPWVLPLAAAAVVVIVSIALAVGNQRAATPPAGPVGPSVVQSTSPVASTAGTTTEGTWAPTAVGPLSSNMPVEGPVGPNLRAVTFTSPDDGWLLASTTCPNGTSGCLALMHTVDGGAHWIKVGPGPAQLMGYDCSRLPCINNIQFASSQIGYAFGPDALYLTTDGGVSWALQAGKGADALQIVGDTVVLARVIDTACPERCPLLLTSPVGSTDWEPFTLPDVLPGTRTVQFASNGRQVALLANPSDLSHGAGRDNTSALYLSSDGGDHWTAKGEQCPDAGVGYTNHSFDVAVSGDGALAIYCLALSGADPGRVSAATIVSTDDGETFTAPPRGGLLGAAGAFAAVSASVLLVSAPESAGGTSRLYRSTDGGDSWSPVVAIKTPVASIHFLSPQFGWMLSDDGHTLWTTHDGERWVVSGTASTAPAVAPSFIGVHMVDADRGWSLADAGLLYTADGGDTWAVRTPPGVDPIDLPSPTGAEWPHAAAFAGAEELWIVVDQSAKVTVFHTTDAGRSWSSASVAPAQVGDTALTALGLSFPTARDGWLLVDLGAGGLNTWPVALYRTTDAGATWVLADRTIDGQDSPSGLPAGGQKAGLGFVTPDRGWIAGSRGSDPALWLYETTDGGKTWTRTSLPAAEGVDLGPAPVTYPPRFSDDRHGVLRVEGQLTAETRATVFYVTDDGGVTWRPTAPFTSSNGLPFWAWPDAEHGVATDGATWCVTDDGGASGRCGPLPAEMRGMMGFSMPTPDLGWASVYGGLYRTTDGGSTWAQIAVRVTP